LQGPESEFAHRGCKSITGRAGCQNDDAEPGGTWRELQ
jgi:hypothetical protein